MLSLQGRVARTFVNTFLHTRSAGYLPLRVVRRVMDAVAGPVPQDVRISRFESSEFRGEFLTPARRNKDAAILYLHGGAYCLGSCSSHRGLAGGLAKEAGLQAFILDYRLAPEHPFPAAVDDALAAYDLLLEAHEQVVIAGDSAGGGLALAVTLALKEAGKKPPAALILFSPWCDLALAGASMDTLESKDPMLSKHWLKQMARHYLDGRDPRTPMASPLYGDLRELPPLLIQVGSDEVLLDDSRRLAAAASAAGCTVTLQEETGLWHVWQAFGDLVPEAKSALRVAGSFAQARVRENCAQT